MQTFGGLAKRLLLSSALRAMFDSPEVFSFVGSVLGGDANITVAHAFDLQSLTTGMFVTGPGITPPLNIVAIDSDTAFLAAPGLKLSGVIAGPHAGATYQATQGPQLLLNVELYQSATPGPDPLLSDFVLATFDGYGASTPAPTPVTTDASGNAIQNLGLQSWVLPTLPATPNTIQGYVVWYSPMFGVAQVLCFENFDSPRPMQKAGDAIVFSLPLSLQPLAAELIP